jgi:hypothetical protein
MAITGIHTLLHTPQPEEVRAILRDVFGWRCVDAGEGWLIFALPPAEMGVHPTAHPRHELSFMCDDLAATMTELKAKGIHFRGQPRDEGYGIVVTMVLPGGLELDLYEPRHVSPLSG